jgi:hypothetical protein
LFVREALAARSGRDFTIAAPARRSGSARPLAWLWRRPGLAFGSAVFLGAATAIAANALVFQSGRHPAPLFGTADATRPRPVAPPLPPVRPAAAELQPAPAAAAPPAPVAPARPARDPIGDMLRSSETGGIARADARPVAAAQRALTKLGYGPLKADGILGAGTRQALERFERDQKIPVTGDLGPRTARELAAQAGTPIE